jgi:hypothetical protein
VKSGSASAGWQHPPIAARARAHTTGWLSVAYGSSAADQAGRAGGGAWRARTNRTETDTHQVTVPQPLADKAQVSSSISVSAGLNARRRLAIAATSAVGARLAAPVRLNVICSELPLLLLPRGPSTPLYTVVAAARPPSAIDTRVVACMPLRLQRLTITHATEHRSPAFRSGAARLTISESRASIKRQMSREEAVLVTVTQTSETVLP